ncbi:hypothetical protein ATANTOWER_032543, partial [Ataeniobius toweri]|nr:hypothetical protein [Ataeniobius toweri]
TELHVEAQKVLTKSRVNGWLQSFTPEIINAGKVLLEDGVKNLQDSDLCETRLVAAPLSA